MRLVIDSGPVPIGPFRVMFRDPDARYQEWSGPHPSYTLARKARRNCERVMNDLEGFEAFVVDANGRTVKDEAPPRVSPPAPAATPCENSRPRATSKTPPAAPPRALAPAAFSHAPRCPRPGGELSRPPVAFAVPCAVAGFARGVVDPQAVAPLNHPSRRLVAERAADRLRELVNGHPLLHRFPCSPAPLLPQSPSFPSCPT
jgi:hypothetical protein